MAKKAAPPEVPYWFKAKVPLGHDIGALMPPPLPKGKRFETNLDAEKLSAAHERALRRHGSMKAEGLADSLNACRRGDIVCASPTCPVCGRQYRRWLIAQGLRVAAVANRPKVVTVYLCESAEGSLNTANLRKLQGMLRARLRRSKLGKAVVIGGIEVGYRAKRKVWLIHAHLLVAEAPEAAIARFKDSHNSIRKKSVVVQLLKDAPKQVSYLQKFATYHRPGKKKSKGRPVPIPHRPLIELLRFMSVQRFEDFRFLQNVRFTGSRLKVKS